MEEFFNQYQSKFIYIGVIIAAVVALHFLTKALQKWLIKKEKKEFPGEHTTTINLISRILNVLWIVLGIIALSFIFVEPEKYDSLKSNFQLILYLGLLAVLTIVSATSINLWFKRSIQKKIDNRYDPTSYKFLRYVVTSLIYFVGILCALLAFPPLRGVAQTALGGAGVLAIVFGIASQEALSNVVGGIFIISFKPFRIDDLIKVTDTMVGRVTDITLRHTVIRNFDNKMIVIPNSIINKEKLVNYDLGELKCCERLEIQISHDSNVELAKKIMREECESHPLILDNRTPVEKQEGKPIVKTALMSFNEFSLTVRAWAWGKEFDDCFSLRIDVLETIKKRFDKEGIEIPYPYRNIIMKNEKPQT